MLKQQAADVLADSLLSVLAEVRMDGSVSACRADSRAYLHQSESWSTSGCHCPEQKNAAEEKHTDNKVALVKQQQRHRNCNLE